MSFLENRKVCRALLVAAACSALACAQEQTEAVLESTTTSPYVMFQDATITASGGTVTASRVPVVTSSGATLYYDVTLQFVPGSTGGLTLASGYPKVVTSLVNPVASKFVAGNYVGPSAVLSGNAKINVAGPSVAGNNVTEWTANVATGANNCTYPTSAFWYVVSSLANSPIAPRLAAAKITSTAYSYGTLGSEQCGADGVWGNNSLIGVSQVGNKLTIVTFTDGYGNDHNIPQDEITFTLSN